MNSTGEYAQEICSNEIENDITTCIEHFDYEDAIVLAQAYFNRVRNERSLYLLAKCHFLLGKTETAYSLMKCGVFHSANSKYLYSKCAYILGRYDECEMQLRDENVRDRVELHPCFFGTSTFSFAHSLLAKNLRATNRPSLARTHFQESLKRNFMRWSDIKDYCDAGGERMAELYSKTIPTAGRLPIAIISEETRCDENLKIYAQKSVKRASADVGEKSGDSQNATPRKRAQVKNIRTKTTRAEYPRGKPFTVLMDLENADPAKIGPNSARSINTRIKRENLHSEIGAWFVQLAEAQQCLSRFRCAEALAALDMIGIEYAKLPLSLELRARAYFESGEYARCCDACEEIRQLYPRCHQAMEIYSTSLWQLQDAPRLSALCAEMINTARDEPESWCVAGNCFSLEKQHDTAVECLERAARLNPRFGYSYSLLGHELIILNDLQRAESAFRRATICTPNDYRPWYGLGLVYYKLEKMTEAKANLLKAIDINPTNIVVLCQLSVIEQSLNNEVRAMQHLSQALRIAPNNVACLYHKARLLFDTERYEESMCELKKLMSLSPDEAHVFYLLGRVYRRLGDHHMALLSYSWATEIDPRGEQNHSALADHGLYDDDPVDLNDMTAGNTPPPNPAVDSAVNNPQNILALSRRPPRPPPCAFFNSSLIFLHLALSRHPPRPPPCAFFNSSLIFLQ